MTIKEQQDLYFKKHATLEEMHIAAVAANNTSDIFDIELQLKKVRIQIAALGGTIESPKTDD